VLSVWAVVRPYVVPHQHTQTAAGWWQHTYECVYVCFECTSLASTYSSDMLIVSHVYGPMYTFDTLLILYMLAD